MKGKITICIFGDSIVYGQGDTEGGGWAIRLRNYFEARANKQRDVRTYVLGIRGETARGLLTRLEGECVSRNPHIVIFAIGINDSQYNIGKENTRASLSKFKQNLENLLDISSKFNSKVVFIGLTCVDESKTTPTTWGVYYDNEHIKRYDEIIKVLCRAQHITYIPMFDILSEPDLIDGIHSNTVGHKKIFENVRKNLENVLK